MVYPVGSIYTNASNSANPATLLGFGTWEAFASGRVMVGKASSGTFATAGATMGAETHQHRQSGMARTNSGAGGGEQVTAWNEGCYGVSGSSVSYANYGTVSLGGVGASKTVYPWLTEAVSGIQPSIVVYMWKRTA